MDYDSPWRPLFDCAIVTMLFIVSVGAFTAFWLAYAWLSNRLNRDPTPEIHSRHFCTPHLGQPALFEEIEDRKELNSGHVR